MSFNPQTPQSPCQLSPATVTDHYSSVSTSMTTATTATSNIATLPTPAHSTSGSGPDMVMADAGTPQKRKRISEDAGDQDYNKKAHIEDPRSVGIQDLHFNVGEKYLFCRTPHASPWPRPSVDLIKSFNLSAIAADVARTKPNGEKNALRKTYKGYIKTLGINGHFDPAEKDDFHDQGFQHLAYYPELEWDVQESTGREVENGLSPQVEAALGRACAMAKGSVPKAVWDSSVLGDLNMVKKPKAEKPTAPGTPLVAASESGNASSKPRLPNVDRARRLGKKRSYQDSSFEGYGDGFPDDDTSAAGEAGYSTGGEDRRKRRKQTSIGGQPGTRGPRSSVGGQVGS